MCNYFGGPGSQHEAALLPIQGAAAAEVFEGLLMLQHRGQDSAGMVTYDGARFCEHKANGLVNDVFQPRDMAALRGAAADMAFPSSRSCAFLCYSMAWSTTCSSRATWPPCAVRQLTWRFPPPAAVLSSVIPWPGQRHVPAARHGRPARCGAACPQPVAEPVADD